MGCRTQPGLPNGKKMPFKKNISLRCTTQIIFEYEFDVLFNTKNILFCSYLLILINLKSGWQLWPAPSIFIYSNLVRDTLVPKPKSNSNPQFDPMMCTWLRKCAIYLNTSFIQKLLYLLGHNHGQNK